VNNIANAELHRVISRHYKLNEPDPIGTLGSEILPVAIVADFYRAHPADTEVNKGSYDGLQAAVAAGDIACTFELFNPATSGVIAELCSVIAGATYNCTSTLHIATAKNPYGGGTGTGKLLHLGTQSVLASGTGSAALIDGFDNNRLAQANFGGGFIRICRVLANTMCELMVPGCPIFLMPGTGVRVQVSGGTAGTAFWCAAWTERRQQQLPA